MPSLTSLKKPERWKYASLSQQESTAVELADTVSISTERRLSKDGIFNAFERASQDTGQSMYESTGTLVGDELTTWDSDEPTQTERQTLRKVPDKLPASAFLVAVVELCERFAYYGMSGPFQNYISNRYHDPSGNPGAIGMNQTGATALTNFFQFWCYLTPILGAVCADQWLGKYKTIVLFSVFYLVGLVILFLTSLPVAIEGGYALGGLIAAMVVIGLGTGGIKSNVSPLIAEQYQETKMRVKILPSGEKVIVDPTLTIQRIYMVFYLCINTGSLSAIATTEMELHIGFWSAYLLPLIMFCIGFGVLVAGKKKYVNRPPKGSVIMDSFKALWIGIKSKDGLNAAKPSYVNRNPARPVPWDDNFVEELRRALVACKVFLFFPIYWCVYNQMLNNFVSQAGTMQLHGVPNDIMQNIDPITVIIFIPVFDRVIYPALRKAKIQFKPITRITWGFIMGSLAMAYAAVVQNWIYNAGPCFKTPLKCAAGRLPGGRIEHNHVHVAYQTPAYFFIAISEIFASITGLEYAYTKAPPNMKSFIMSMFLLTNAGGALLGLAISPVARDPNLVWLYTGLAGGSVVTAALFWILFNHYNATEDLMNELDAAGDRPILMDEMAASQPRLPVVNKASNFDIGALTKSGERGKRSDMGRAV